MVASPKRQTCKLCPNNKEAFNGYSDIEPGRAQVAVDSEGAVGYVYNNLKPRLFGHAKGEVGRGVLSSELVIEQYPDLVEAFAACEGSESVLVERNARFNRPAEYQTRCSAIARTIGDLSAINVIEYFKNQDSI